jgi:hypothetical protein
VAGGVVARGLIHLPLVFAHAFVIFVRHAPVPFPFQFSNAVLLADPAKLVPVLLHRTLDCSIQRAR